MADYEAGSAYLQILPSTRGFAQRLKRELGGVREQVTVPVSLDVDRRGLTGLQTALRALPIVVLTADSSPADREVAALRQRIEDLDGQRIGVDLSAAQARHEVDALRTDLDRLSDRSPEIAVRVDAAAASAALAAVDSRVDRVDGRRARARVDVDVIGAIASVAGLALAINQFANRSYSFRVDADTGGAVAGVLKLVAVIGLIGAAGGVIGGLGGALLGIVPAAALAAGGLGTVVLAARGLGGALSALSAQQAAATGTAEEQAAAAEKVTQEFAKLPPAAAEFARHLFGLRPVLDQLSATAATALFPQLQSGLDTLLTRLPLIDTVVGQLAAGMGAGLNLVLTQLASPQWSGFFAMLGNAAGTLLPLFFDAVMQLMWAVAQLITVFMPLAPVALDALNAFSAFIGYLAPYLAVLSAELIPVFVGFLAALRPLGPLLAALAPILAVITEAFGTVLAALLTALTPVLVALTPLIEQLAMRFALDLAAGIEAVTPFLVMVAGWLSQNPGLVYGVITAIGVLASVFRPLLFVLGLAATALHGFLVIKVAQAALTAFGLQGTVIGKLVMRLLSPLNLLRMAFPLLAAGIRMIGRAILTAMGPLGWILTILGLLYTSNEAFRNTVNLLLGVLMALVTQVLAALMPAFQAIMAALMPLVPLLVSALVPIFNVLAGVLIQLVMTVLPPLVAILTNVVVPVIRFLAQVLATVLVWVITTVVVPALHALVWVMSTLVAPAIMWLWRNVVAPAFAAIGAAVVFAWTYLIKPALDALMWVVRNILAPLVMWLWNNVVRPYFQLIGAYVSFVWNYVIKPAWDALMWVVRNVLAPLFVWLYRNVIKPNMDAFGAVIRFVWNRVILPVFDALKAGVGLVGDAFAAAVGFIGRMWDKLKRIAAVPVNFVIREVYNRGIKAAWDKIAGWVRLPQLPVAREVRWATGGPVTRPTYGLAGEAGPEYILSHPAVRALGGIGAADELHRGLLSGAARRAHERHTFRDLQAGRLVEGAGHDGPGARRSGFGGVRPHVAMAGHFLKRMFGVGTVGGVGGRPGPSDHPSGHALDFMTYRDMGKGDRLAAYALRNAAHLAIKYIIWKQRINSGSGWRRQKDRGNPTANHMDHPHISFLRAGERGRGFSGGGDAGGGFLDVLGSLKSMFAGAVGKAKGLAGKFGDTPLAKVVERYPTTMIDKVVGWAVEKAKDTAGGMWTGLMGAFGSFGDAVTTGVSVGRWTPHVLRALGMLGESPLLVPTVLRRMNQESGGNPRAINLWDSNARRGTPSKGLMQVISTTFAAYRDRRAPNDVWDPMANILASMRYAKAIYGSLPRAYNRRGGYDDGGVASGIGLLWKGTGLDERMLDPQETQAYPTLTRLSRQLEAGRVLVPAGRSSAEAAALAAGRAGEPTQLVGALYLDSGEFLGRVRGEVRSSLDDEATTLTHGRRP